MHIVSPEPRVHRPMESTMLEKNTSTTTTFEVMSEGVIYRVIAQQKYEPRDEDIVGKEIVLVPDKFLPGNMQDPEGKPLLFVIEAIENRDHDLYRAIFWVRDIDAIGDASIVAEVPFPRLNRGGMLVDVQHRGKERVDDSMRICFFNQTGLRREKTRSRKRGGRQKR